MLVLCLQHALGTKGFYALIKPVHAPPAIVYMANGATGHHHHGHAGVDITQFTDLRINKTGPGGHDFKR
jgi:hypothetical protein